MTVYDSSALLAFLFDEPGAAVVAAALEAPGWCGAANWAETAQKAIRRGIDWRQAEAVLLRHELDVEPVDQVDAERAATLWREHPTFSLGDRLCLALGERFDTEVLTADQAWTGSPGVILIR